MKRINLSTILAVAGGVGVFAPDLSAVATWLAGTGVPWLGYVARGLGAAALLASSLPRIVTRLRPLLAAANLATPTGATPSDPREVPAVTESPHDPQKGGTVVSVLVVLLGIAATAALIAAALSVAGCKTAAPAPDTFAARVVTCAVDNDANPVASSAVLACLTGGTYAACLAGLPAAGHWTVDEIACLVRGYAASPARVMLAAQPAANPAREHAAAWLREQRIAFRP